MLFKSVSGALKFGACMFLIFSLQSYASVVVNGTRVIYPGNEKEVTIKVSNVGKNPVLIQGWVDTGEVNDKPEKIKVPFILTPPINRIDPNKSQTLRLSYTAAPSLPENNESIYWLNVLEIPSVTKNAPANRLQIAFRTRIKIFYRPASIADKNLVNEAQKRLKWTVNNDVIKATNDSPYYISLTSVSLNQNGNVMVTEGDMIAPKSSYSFSMKGAKSSLSGGTVTYEYIDDWGAVKTVKSQY